MTGEKGAWETKWSLEDLNRLTGKVELIKNQSIGSLASVTEIVEILELLRGMALGFPLSQQRYFQETVNELVGLAVGHLEDFRAEFQFAKGGQHDGILR